ncbi:hypothetical protein D5S17_31285 [Pseudonocardiaceae bacterium YIM PH 21723]|nr:hypothetical protein D5S17_31285 [Pseudonocardiaceae bacterium YIM PH 21723]
MLPLQCAAEALAWRGVVIPDVEVLGQRVSAVVRLRHDVHDWRSRNGWPPESDPSWFRSWFDPSLHDQIPVPGVDLIGVLVPENRIDRALRSCGTLMTLAPCAVVLPATDMDPWPLIELDYYGVGVVTIDAEGTPAPVVPAEDRSTEFGPSLFGRWLLEVLYAKVLDLATTAAPLP